VGSSGNYSCKQQVFDAPSRWFLEWTWWKGQIMARQKHHERVAFETSQKKARSLTIQEAVTAREILLVVVNSAIHSDLVVLWFVSKTWLLGVHLIYG